MTYVIQRFKFKNKRLDTNYFNSRTRY